MAENIPTTSRGRSRRSMNKNMDPTMEAEWATKRMALKVAKRKAQVEERQAVRQMKEQEKILFRVNPRKEDIATYFLKERSEFMIENGLWYKYHVPTEYHNPEVTLELYKRDEESGDMNLLGVVGDLYSLSLDLYCGTTLEVNVIVESREVRLRDDLALFYSCFDMGLNDKAYTIHAQTWFNYLLYCEENQKVELDTRLLFSACGNREWIQDMAYPRFTRGSRNDYIQLLQSMEPGKVYPRPSVDEALLDTDNDPLCSNLTHEILRMDGLNLPPTEFKTKMKRERIAKRKPSPQPSLLPYSIPQGGLLARGPPAPKKNRSNNAPNYTLPRAAQQLILDCVNPWNEEMIQSKLLNKACRSLLHEKAWTMRRSPRPDSPATLKSWSGSGWETEDSNPGTPDVSAQSDVETDVKETSTVSYYIDDLALNQVVVASPDPPLINLGSPMAEVQILSVSIEEIVDVSPDVSDLETEDGGSADEEELDNGEDVDAPDDESISFEDSIDLFLAKQRSESEIVTVSSSDSNPSEDSVNSSPMTEFGPFSPDPSLYEEDSDEDEDQAA